MFTIYFDTETGGTQPQHPTIQLAAVAMDGDSEVGSFEQCIAFNEADCDPEALKMNHYDPVRWTETAVTPAICAARFAAWLRPFQSVTLTSKRTGQPYTVAQLAGYNAVTFDEPRLRQMFGEKFTPWSYLVRDVLQRVLFYFDENPFAPQPENFKLSTVAAHFLISTEGAHGALADARMCAAVARAVREASEGW